MSRVISLDDAAQLKKPMELADQMERARRAELIATYHVLVSFAALGETTTYGKLYDILAPQFGWRERSNGNWWARYVTGHLAEMGRLNKENGEPVLSALVRQAKKGNPIGVGYKTAHLNRYGVTLTPHEGGCDCDDCYGPVAEAADVETRKCFEHFSRARSDG